MKAKQTYPKLANSLEKLRLEPNSDVSQIYEVIKKIGAIKDVPDFSLARIDCELLKYLTDDTVDIEDKKILAYITENTGNEVWKRSEALTD